MKKILQTLCHGVILCGIGMCAVLGGGTAVQAAEVKEIPVTADYFPEDWMRKIVKPFDTDGDGILSETEIAAVTKLSITKVDYIVDLSPFQYFTNLRELELGSEEQSFRCFRSMDFTGYPDLERLVLYRRIANSDVNASGLTHLKKLTIVSTELDDEDCEDDYDIDLRGTPALETVYIQCVDAHPILDSQTAIKKLYLYSDESSLVSFDGFPQLEEFGTNAIRRDVTSLDFTPCSRLKTLKLQNTRLEEVILPPSLKVFELGTDSELKTPLNLSDVKGLQELTFACENMQMPDLSDHTKLVSLSLTCQLPRKLDFSCQKQLETLYLEDCLTGEQKASGTKGNSTLSLASNTKLKNLELHQFSIKRLDLSRQKKLESLGLCNVGSLTKLDLSKQTRLKSLKLEKVQSLKGLDLSKQKNLESLELWETGQLASLKLPKTDTLQVIHLWAEVLSSVDFSVVKNLRELKIKDYNSLSGLDLSQNRQLTKLDIYEALSAYWGWGASKSYDNVKWKIKQLDLSKNKKLEGIDLNGLAIDSLSLTHQTQLRELKVLYCAIKKLDVRKAANVKHLEVEGCRLLTDLDLSKNRKLEMIDLQDNKRLKTLVIGKKPVLRCLICYGSKVKTLDLSKIGKKYSPVVNVNRKIKVIGY